MDSGLASPYFGCITNQRGEGNDLNLYSSQPRAVGLIANQSFISLGLVLSVWCWFRECKEINAAKLQSLSKVGWFGWGRKKEIAIEIALEKR